MRSVFRGALAALAIAVRVPSMSGKTIWIGTSWKMNKTISEARDYIGHIVGVVPMPGVQAFVLPAHTALAAVRDSLPEGAPLLLGAQNAHWGDEGAGTGEVSMRMVKDAGASLVEMGHAERREHFGETDETVSMRARAAIDHDLVPLICVGEPGAVRDAGNAEEYVKEQLRAAISRLTSDEVQRVLVAYEPVWAIGTGGRPATRHEVAPVMAALSAELSAHSAGRGCRALLYGGGVNADNAADLLHDPHVDGLFVGRAAWSAAGLTELLKIGAEYAARNVAPVG